MHLSESKTRVPIALKHYSNVKVKQEFFETSGPASPVCLSEDLLDALATWRKQFTVSSPSATLISVCFSRSGRLSWVRHLQNPSIPFPAIYIITSVVFEKAKTLTASCLLLQIWKSYQSFVVRFNSLEHAPYLLLRVAIWTGVQGTFQGYQGGGGVLLVSLWLWSRRIGGDTRIWTAICFKSLYKTSLNFQSFPFCLHDSMLVMLNNSSTLEYKAYSGGSSPWIEPLGPHRSTH